MTGPLTLPGNATLNLHAVPKQQLDMGLANYVLKAGDTMLGPLALSGNAVTALQAVPLQQMQAADATKIGDAPNDGAYYARRNLAWAVAPGSAISTDAPSDGTAYGRLNAAWQKTPWFTAKGNVMLGVPEPANMSTTTALDGGSLVGWYVTANNYMSSMYYDGTNYRRLNATVAPSQIIAGGAYQFQSAAVGAADSTIPTLNTLFTMRADTSAGTGAGPPSNAIAGLLSSTNGLLTASYLGFNMYNGPSNWFARATGFSAMLYFDAGNGSLNVYTGGSVAAGAVTPISQRAIFSPSLFTVNSDIVATGAIWAANLNGSFGLQNFGGGWWGLRLNSPGWRIQWNSANGDLQFVNDTGSARFTSFSGGTFTTAGYISAGGADGNGYGFTSGYGAWLGGSLYAASNVTAGSGVYGGYIRSYGDMAVDANFYCTYMRVANGIMNYNGTMWVADNNAYYMARNSSDGYWRFVDNNNINIEIRPWGEVYIRGRLMVYGGDILCTNASIGVRYSSGSYSTGQAFLFGWNNVIGNLATISIDNGGAVYAMANASDARLKGEIATSDHDCLATVQKLAVRRFRWKTMNDPWSLAKARMLDDAPLKRVGLVAQEVREAFPEGAWEGDDFEDHLGRVWGLDQNAMIALLVGATQQMAARLATLEGRHK